MKVQKRIEVWLVKKRLPRPIDVVQYDKGIQLVFEVQDFTIPDGTTAKLYVQKPSGKFVYQETGITVAGNTITIDLENQAITEHGNYVPYQVQLSNGADVITTFAGIMRVEKSLKDAGATESKTVILAFDEAVSDHVAEFQAKAEQIVQACIATIPADYSAMVAKVNESANAVKGYLSGAVVFADDVSPVVHSPVVWAHGKNLFNGELLSGVFLSESFSLDAENGLVFKSIKAHLRPGTYTVSFGKKVNIVRSIIDGAYAIVGYVGATQHTFTVATAGTVGFTFRDSTSITTEWDDSVAIQIEVGTTATDYEPYIDPSTVKVRRCGKNIFGVAAKSQTINGVTFTVNNNGTVTATGTAEKTTFIGLGSLVLKPGEKYRLSGSPAGSGFDTYLLYIHNNTTGADIYDMGEGKVFTGKEGNLGVTIAVYAGNTVNNLLFRPMVVYGEAATAFEPYNAATYIPAADGAVSGLTSLSPNMTILTDTDGAIVECEYNVDTKTFIKKLLAGASAVRVADVELLASAWVGTASPYSQVITIAGTTEYSQVNLNPSVEQMAIFYEKDLTFVTENEDGVITVYAIGQKPSNDYTIQATIKEVSV